MKSAIPFFLLPAALLFQGATATAQTVPDSLQLWRIETNDGNNYVGIILRRDLDNIFPHSPG